MGVENTPRRQARRRKARKRQEDRWAAKSGPVTVRRVDDPAPEPSADVADDPTEESSDSDRQEPPG